MAPICSGSGQGEIMAGWHTVAKLSELPDGKGKSVRVPWRRKPLAVFNCSGTYYVVDDECPHANASLAAGTVKDFRVSCPEHGAQFDVRTGEGFGALAYRNLRTFPSRVNGDEVQVEIPD